LAGSQGFIGHGATLPQSIRIASDRKEHALKHETVILPAFPARIHFPVDEARQPWLALLLDVHRIN
jgi:hypothetical protein